MLTTLTNRLLFKTCSPGKTIKMIGQLLTLNKINDFIVDFTDFVDEATTFLGGIEHKIR